MDHKEQQLWCRESAQGVNDCTELRQLSVDAICQNLKTRYLSAPPQIYTWVSSVLLSVNPYEPCSHLYNDTVKETYLHAPTLRNVSPHIYAVGAQCYRKLFSAPMQHPSPNNFRQTLLITGESGSGKTEACQYLMSFFEYASRQRIGNNHVCNGRSDSDTFYRIDNLLFKAGRLLEVFGNAQTQNNQNSSRFGKLTAVNFNKEGCMQRATLQTYLLGKARVTAVQPGCQNFHCFHLLLKERPDFPGNACMRSPNEYKYMKPTAAATPVIPEHLTLFNVEEALKALGFTDADRAMIWRIVLGILELGNVEFHSAPGKHSAVVSDMVPLCNAADLLGLASPEEAAVALITQRVHDQVRELSVEKANENRDGLSRLCYEQLFHFLVRRINASLGKATLSDDAEIDILDIYGFEEETVNSFEQFCINYANEKLQQCFMAQLVLREQDLYREEGLPCVVTRSNTTYKPIIEFFEGVNGRVPILGAFSLLKDAGHIPGVQSRDFYFCDAVHKLKNTLNSKQTLAQQRFQQPSRTTFVVDHSFQSITYSVEGFVHQDRDALTRDLRELVGRHLTWLGPEGKVAVASRTESVGIEFSVSLKTLLDRLLISSTITFVRCLKPNKHQTPRVFDEKRVALQLEYGAMDDVVQTMKLGYPCRLSYSAIRSKFSRTAGRLKPQAAAEMLLALAGVPKTDYALGVSKIFFRGHVEKTINFLLNSATSEDLERFRKKLARRRFVAACYAVCYIVHTQRYCRRRVEAAVVIQSTWRYLIAEAKFIERVEALELLQSLLRKGRQKGDVSNAEDTVKEAPNMHHHDTPLSSVRSEPLEKDQNQTIAYPQSTAAQTPSSVSLSLNVLPLSGTETTVAASTSLSANVTQSANASAITPTPLSKEGEESSTTTVSAGSSSGSLSRTKLCISQQLFPKSPPMNNARKTPHTRSSSQQPKGRRHASIGQRTRLEHNPCKGHHSPQTTCSLCAPNLPSQTRSRRRGRSMSYGPRSQSRGHSVAQQQPCCYSSHSVERRFLDTKGNQDHTYFGAVVDSRDRHHSTLGHGASRKRVNSKTRSDRHSGNRTTERQQQQQQFASLQHRTKRHDTTLENDTSCLSQRRPPLPPARLRKAHHAKRRPASPRRPIPFHPQLPQQGSSRPRSTSVAPSVGQRPHVVILSEVEASYEQQQQQRQQSRETRVRRRSGQHDHVEKEDRRHQRTSVSVPRHYGSARQQKEHNANVFLLPAPYNPRQFVERSMRGVLRPPPFESRTQRPTNLPRTYPR